MDGGGIRKLLQRQLYTFLSSKWGVLLCLIGFLTLLNASFTVFMILLGNSSALLWLLFFVGLQCSFLDLY